MPNPYANRVYPPRSAPGCTLDGGRSLDSLQRHWQAPFSHTHLPRADEPTKAKPVGAAHDASLGIYFSNAAAQTIDALLHDKPRHPWRGILVGYAAQGPARPYVLVVGAIVAPAAAGGSGFHVSSPSYDTLYDVWQRDYPGTVVVGWFRAHPGYGVKMSADDRFTHQTFFPQPWHIAFIVDPVRASSAFYIAPAGQPAPVEAFYLWNPQDDVRLLAWLQQQTERATGGVTGAAAAAPGRAKRKRHAPWLLLGLAAALILFPLVWRGLPGVQKQLPAATERLSTLQTEIQQAEAVKFHLQEKADEVKTGTAADATRLSDRNEASNPHHETSTEDETGATSGGSRADADTTRAATGTISGATTPASASATTDNNGPPGTVAFPGAQQTPSESGTAYTVAPGDTLWDISQRLFGDPTNYKKIAESNAIPNPDVIFPGMALQLHGTPVRNGHDDEAQATESE